MVLTGTGSPTIQVFDPDNILVDSSDGFFLETAPVATDGPYTVRVGQQGAGMGLYNLSVVLNAAVEPENYGRALNDTPAESLDLDPGAVRSGTEPTGLRSWGQLIASTTTPSA